MADSNLVENPLLEKIQDLLKRKPGICDVAFGVGKEKKIVRALKVILKASSPFLEKEFEEKWEVDVVKEGDGIPLPEFDPIAFELFVKLTSLDTWSLEILNTLNLPQNQYFNLLTICQRFEMQKGEEILKILATKFIQSFDHYTDDFLQLSQNNLRSVLASDDIGIEELDVFRAAIRWADFQCKEMNVEPTYEKLRQVLGECLSEIRFPLMTCTEFTEAQELKDILTAEESLEIYRFIGLTGNKKLKFDSKKLPFKTTPRNKVQTSVSKRNSETNNNDSLIPPEISRLGLTRGLGSAKNPPIVYDISRKTQLRPQSLESASSLQLPAASLSKTIHWGKKVYGFPSRRQHSAVAVGNSVYSFGGGNYGDLSYSRHVLDVFVLNVNEREKKWKKLPIQNSEVNPNQRRDHSAVAHKKFVLIFGGLDTKKWKESNSTYRLNTDTLKWDKPEVNGNIPAARYNHSAVVCGNNMLIYGGRGYADEVTNDLHSLDLESFRWSIIETKGISPSIREGHSATVHSDRFILIFGGIDFKESKTVNTIWSFDLSNKTWTAVETCGALPSSRRQHCAFVHSGRMYIFGGSRKYVSYFNDVFCYDPETLEWKEVTPNGEAPSPRDAAGCVALNDQVFIFGGHNSEENLMSDTCVLQM